MLKWLEKLYSYSTDNKKVLWCAVILAVIPISIYAIFCSNMYDDVARCYAPMARDIGNGRWHQAFTGYDMIAPLNQTLAGLLCLCGVQPYPALIIISGLFYVLTIFPLYSLLQRFMPQHHAAWGCLAYVLAPKIIRFSGTGLLNSSRNFFIIWALALLLKFFDSYERRQLVWLGIALGGLALVRGEGIAFVPLFGLFFVVMFYLRQRQNDFLHKLPELFLHLTIMAVVFVAVISPRLLQMYHDTGYPVIDRRQSHYLYFLLGTPDNMPQRAVNTAAPAAPASSEQAVTPTSGKNAKKRKDRPRWLEFLTDVSRGSYEFYLTLAVIGVVITVKRQQWRMEYYLIFAIALFNAAIFYSISLAYRYFTVNLLLFMPFTVTGALFLIDQINNRLPEKLRPRLMLFLLLLAAATWQITNGMAMVKHHRRRWFFRPVGEWLQQQSPKHHLVILSVQPQFAFWANATRPNIDLRRPDGLMQLQKVKFDYIVIANRHREKLLKALDDLGYQRVKHPYQEVVTIYRRKP